ncbi:response regulator [Reichenbachiella carrageenanivorans]|uniref:histidine kinase n=1 Tax=Reichenbachiella carrageenanivorans TaxID=2979869 RepID=A0ABY6D265_9BACT|nr:hybrid sensor histidine kinase/response regulator transcription factor [Reichenbachiella carrageenanivorans]UXX79834.1 response regulator [Reichenbachiella carrageenanivorans]
MDFKYLGIEEGLPSNKVFMTLEDQEGFVWMATDNGIARYDGRSLKTYELQNIEDIRKRSFVSLFLGMDGAGTVWLISNNGLLFYYDQGQDQFQYYDQVLPPGATNIYITEFYIDHADRFLIGSFNGVSVYLPKDQSIMQLPDVSKVVSSIIQSDDHTYYIGGRGGIFVLNSELKFLSNLKAKVPKSQWTLDQQRIESLYLQSADHQLWVGTESAGLYSYDLRHDQLTPVGLEREIDISIRSIKDFGGGQFFIGTDGGGIILFDAFKHEVLATATYQDDQQHSLSSNAVYDIQINAQGVVFVSTYRGGVNIYNPQRQKFYDIRHVRGESNSLSNDVVFSIVEPMSGYISFGTDKGISIWNKTQNTWEHLRLDTNEELSKSAVVLSQTVDSQDNLWVASYVYALSQFSPTASGFRLSSSLTRLGDPSKVKRVFFHPHGELLVGTINSSLFSYPPSGEIDSYEIREPSDMEMYSDQKAIITNRDGIALLDLAYKEVTWIGKEKKGSPLSKMVCVSVLVDEERALWVGTIDHGVCKIDVQGNILEQYDTSSGMASNTVLDLLADTENNVWVATPNGISKIAHQKVVNFYESDGLISTDFNRNAAFLDSDGQLYFGTNKGVITFDPKTITPTQIEKKIVLTDFFLNHERILAGAHTVLQKPLNEIEQMSLAYDQNSFSLGFVSIDFMHAAQGQFVWRLDGFDKDWIVGEGQERATYTNLDPGHYTFRLKMTDGLGHQIGDESRLSLTISQPFWKTPWAYMVYFVFILSLVMLLLYFNRLRMESKNAEERLHFLIEMAHEIKTPLTLIRAPLTDLLSNAKTDDAMKESLQVALDSAEKLHKQMMQFLDFRRINVRRDSLQIAPLDLVAFINTKRYAFKVLADKKNIDLKFEHAQPEAMVNSDDKILDKIVSNIISNAIKYTREGGQVALALKVSNKNWTLSVADNGIGISKEDQKRIFTLFYRTQNARSSGSSGSGVGLVLASDLARTMNGSVRLVRSDQSGSEFLITMPMFELADAPLELEDHPMMPAEQELEIESRDNSKLSILMVEDDEALRNYQKSKFESEYHVLTASNGEEAMKIVHASPPDMIISDVVMPKMNGRQLCMNIKSNVATSHIPFILLTGQESKDHVQQGFESGADDYIVKPFEFEILSSKIRNLLKTRAAIKDRFVASEEEETFQDISNELDQKFLDEITSMIEDNISDPELSVNHICHAIGMSRTSLYHKLKALVDMSPAEFIRTIRLKRARKLLLNPMNNISEVAYSTGFSDAKYFSTLFKKYYDQSPSAFVADKKGSH